MKGYFSSLAKQSGLRVSGSAPGARLSPAAAEAPPPEPLHREETVLLPPTTRATKGENAAPRQPAPTPDAPKPRIANSPVTDGFPEFGKTTREVRDEKPIEPGTPEKIETISVEPPRPDNRRENADPLKVPGNTDSRAHDAAPQTVTIEHQKFVERDDASTVSPAFSEAPGPSQTITPPPVEQREFFVKTAEIIERGEAGPADIGSIIFKEVREWVASGPQAADDQPPGPPAVEMITLTDKPREVAEPGTIVIRNTSIRETPAGPAALEEQNFSLSIGTISVIIEDQENAPEPVRVIQNERPQSASTGTKREFSRFSRNYL